MARIYWIIAHPPTRRHIPGSRTVRHPTSPSNRELTADEPPRLFPSERGARASLKRWLMGRVGHRTTTSRVIMGGGQMATLSPLEEVTSGKTKFAYVRQPERDAIAHEMVVMPVSLRIED